MCEPVKLGEYFIPTLLPKFAWYTKAVERLEARSSQFWHLEMAAEADCSFYSLCWLRAPTYWMQMYISWQTVGRKRKEVSKSKRTCAFRAAKVLPQKKLVSVVFCVASGCIWKKRTKTLQGGQCVFVQVCRRTSRSVCTVPLFMQLCTWSAGCHRCNCGQQDAWDWSGLLKGL